MLRVDQGSKPPKKGGEPSGGDFAVQVNANNKRAIERAIPALTPTDFMTPSTTSNAVCSS